MAKKNEGVSSKKNDRVWVPRLCLPAPRLNHEVARVMPSDVIRLPGLGAIQYQLPNRLRKGV